MRDGTLGAPRLIRTFIYGSEVRAVDNTPLWKGPPGTASLAA